MIEFITTLPIWQMIRSLGIVSYILLTVGICLGIGYSFPIWPGKTKAKLFKVHTFSTIAGTGVGLLHGIITVIDQYTPYKWGEILVPFSAANAPFLNGLGTLGGYGMLLVIFTSDIRNKLKKKIWFAIHLLSYPIFGMAFIHGYFIGTDSHLPGIKWMYFLSVVLVIALTALRSMVRTKPKMQTAVSLKN